MYLVTSSDSSILPYLLIICYNIYMNNALHSMEEEGWKTSIPLIEPLRSLTQFSSVRSQSMDDMVDTLSQRMKASINGSEWELEASDPLRHKDIQQWTIDEIGHLLSIPTDYISVTESGDIDEEALVQEVEAKLAAAMLLEMISISGDEKLAMTPEQFSRAVDSFARSVPLHLLEEYGAHEGNIAGAVAQLKQFFAGECTSHVLEKNGFDKHTELVPLKLYDGTFDMEDAYNIIEKYILNMMSKGGQ